MPLFCLSDWIGAGVVLARTTKEEAVFLKSERVHGD